VGAARKPTSSELTELEQRLRALRADAVDAIRTRLAGTENGQPRSLGSMLGEGEPAVEDMFAETQLALVRHELDTLRDIDAALRRIEFDVGGICTACGAAISPARLCAVPTAATCVACATAQNG